jgi:hypothetical protein
MMRTTNLHAKCSWHQSSFGRKHHEEATQTIKTRTINDKDNSKYELREDERHIPVTLQGLQLDNNTAAVLSERAVDLELIDD